MAVIAGDPLGVFEAVSEELQTDWMRRLFAILFPFVRDSIPIAFPLALSVRI